MAKRVDPALWRLKALHEDALFTASDMADLVTMMRQSFGQEYTKSVVQALIAKMNRENEK